LDNPWRFQCVQDELLLAERCGLDVSVWTVGRYLQHWGLPPQTPRRRAFERDPAAGRRWLTEAYPAIRHAASQAGAEVRWGDARELRSDQQTGTSAGRQGQPPVIPGTGQRCRGTVLSTITTRGQVAFVVVRRRFTTPVFLRFLRRLLRHVRRPVFLIVDRHPVHVAKAVQRWVAQQPDRLQLFFLPGDSPELNPDALLTTDVKSTALGRRRPREAAELVTTVRSYLWSTQRQPMLVQSSFQAERVQYAAEHEMSSIKCSW
jgi:hypothetical protein